MSVLNVFAGWGGLRSEGLYIPHPLGNPCTPYPYRLVLEVGEVFGLCDVFGLVGLRSGHIGDVGYNLDNLFGLTATVQYIGFESVGGCGGCIDGCNGKIFFYFF